MNYFAQSKGDELIMAATGRLIVILAAEVVGYATLIRADEKGTLEQLEAHRDQFIYPKIRLIRLSQVDQYLGLPGRIRNGAGFVCQ